MLLQIHCYSYSSVAIWVLKSYAFFALFEYYMKVFTLFFSDIQYADKLFWLTVDADADADICMYFPT